MKLHLPTRLRAAVLACFAVVTSFSSILATGVLAGGVFALAMSGSRALAEYDGTNAILSGTDNRDIFGSGTPVTVPEGKTLTFAMEGTGSTNWFNNGASYNADIIIDGGAGGTTGMCINNGGDGTVTFAGAVTGGGLISKTGPGTGMTLRFTGNVSEFTGNINLGASAAFTLKFESTNNSSETKGVSGTGDITFKTANNTLEYNYSTGNTVYVTNAITKNGGTSKVKLSGTDAVVFTKSVVIDSLTSSASSITFANGSSSSLGGLNASAQSVLTVNQGGSLTLGGSVTVRAAIVNNGALTFAENVQLDLSGLRAVGNTYTVITGNAAEGFAALTASNVTGINLTVYDVSFNADGTITRTAKDSACTYSGGTLSWDTTSPSFDGNKTFSNNGVAIFTGNSTVSLAENITAASVVIEEDAGVSLSGAGNSLTATQLDLKGTLVLNDNALNAASRVTGNGNLHIGGEVLISDRATLSGFTNTITVLNGGVLKADGNASGSAGIFGSIYGTTGAPVLVVENGGMVDINGKADVYYKVILKEGATYANTSSTGIRDNSRQLPVLVLEGDATITANAELGMRASSGATGVPVLTLNGHTLTKNGSGTFFLHNTTADAGTISVEAGTLSIRSGGTYTNTNINVGAGASLDIAGATLNGTVTVGNGATFQANGANSNYAGTDVTLEEGGSLVYRTGGHNTFKSFNTTGAATFDAAAGNYNMTVTEASVIGGRLTKTNAGGLIWSNSVELTGGIDIQQGTVTFNGAATVSGTLTVAAGATLNVGETGSVIIRNLSGFEVSSTEPAQNGIATVDYRILDNSGTSNITSVTYNGASHELSNGNLSIADLYYVISDTVTVGGNSATADTDRAGGFVVKSGAVLDIHGNASGSLDVHKIVTTTSGTGTMILRSSTTLTGSDSTIFAGDLEIASGTQLGLGGNATGGITDLQNASIASLNSTVLNGGTLCVRGVEGNLGTIISKEGSTGSVLQIYDMVDENDDGVSGVASGTLSLDKLQLDADVTLKCDWKSNINLALLTGDGNLSMERAMGDTVNLAISSLQGYSGSMSLGVRGKTTNISVSTGSAAVNMGGMTVTGSTLNLNLQADATLSEGLTLDGSTVNVSVGAGCSLNAAVKVNGDANTLTSAQGSLDLSRLNVAEGASLDLNGAVSALLMNQAGTVNIDGMRLTNGAVLTYGDAANLLNVTDAILEGNVVIGTGLSLTETPFNLGLSSAIAREKINIINYAYSTLQVVDDSWCLSFSADNVLFVGADGVNYDSAEVSGKDTICLTGGELLLGDTNVSSAFTTLDIAAAGGSIKAAGTEAEVSFNTVTIADNATVTLKDGATDLTLKAGALNLGTDSRIVLEAGQVLDLTAIDNMDDEDTGKFSKLLNATSGAGTLKVNMPGEFRMKTDTTLSTNLEAEQLKINSWGSGGKTLTVTENIGISLTGRLIMQSTAKTLVEGGSITADKIELGHSQSGNPGHLAMTSGSIVTKGIVHYNDNNTFTMSGGTLTITSSDGIGNGIVTTITGGTLVADGADWGMTGASVGGVTVQGGNTITLTNATLTDSIDNSAGKLALAGTVTLPTDGGTAVEKWSHSGNGYLAVDKHYTIAESYQNLTATGVTWQIDGAAARGHYEQDAGKAVYILDGTQDTSTFVVNTGTVEYSADNSPIEAETTSIKLNGNSADGADTLQLNSSLREGLSITAVAGSSTTINLNGTDVVLDAAQLGDGVSSATVTLTGNGKYIQTHGNSTLKTAGLNDADNWQGTVVISGSYSTATPDKYGNRNSSVEFKGFSGYWQQNNTVFNTNIVLTNPDNDTPAIKITNGYGGAVLQFNGSISGTGDILRNTDKGGTQTYVFAGDVSRWEGSFRNNGTTNGTIVRFTGGSDIKANFDRGQNYNLQVEVDASGNEVEMSGSITATSLTVAQGTTVQITGPLALDGALTTDGVTKLAGDVTNGTTLRQVAGTGALEILTGDLTLTAKSDFHTLAMAAGSKLNLDLNTLGVTDLKNWSTGPMLTLDTLRSAGALSISALVDGAALLTLTDGESKTLAQITNCNTADLTLLVNDVAGSVQEKESDGFKYEYKLVKEGDSAQVLITASRMSEGWVAQDTDPDSLSDTTWTDGDRVGEGKWSGEGTIGKFYGFGEGTVNIEDDGVTITDSVVISAVSGTTEYTFAGGALNAAELYVTEGKLTIDNAGVTATGDAVLSHDSELTVNEKLTVGGDMGVLDSAGLGNSGTVEVLGTLSVAAGAEVSNSGTLIAGTLDAAGAEINSTGTLQTAGGTIGSLTGNGILENSGELTIQETTTLSAITNSGKLTVEGTLNVAGSVSGGEIHAESADLGNADVDVLNVAGAVTAAELSVGSATVQSLTADKLSSQTGNTVKVENDATLGTFSVNGVLEVGGKLTAAQTVESQGEIHASAAELTDATLETVKIATELKANNLVVSNLETASLNASSLTIANGGAGVIGSGVTLDKYSSGGKLSVQGDLAVNSSITQGGTVQADNITVGGTAAFTGVTTGKLTADSVSLTDGHINTLNTAFLTVNGNVAVTENVSLQELAGSGKLTVENNLTLEGVIRTGVDVAAGQVELTAAGSSLGSVQTNAVSMAEGMTLSLTDALLTVEDIAALSGETVAISVSNSAFASLTRDEDGRYVSADYLIIDGAGRADGFSYANTGQLQEILSTGVSAGFAVTDGVLSLRISAVTDAGGEEASMIWDARNEVANNGYVIDRGEGFYKALDYVQKVRVTEDTTFDLSDAGVGDAVAGNASIPALGLMVRNLSGGSELTVKGNGAAADAVTFLNTEYTSPAEAVRLNVDAATAHLGLPVGVDGRLAGDADSFAPTLKSLALSNRAVANINHDAEVLGDTELGDYTRLMVQEGNALTTGMLSGTDEAEISGAIRVLQGGVYTGMYDEAHLTAASGSNLRLRIGGRRDLGLVTQLGSNVSLDSAGQDGRMDYLRVGVAPMARLAEDGAAELRLLNASMTDKGIEHSTVMLTAQEGNYINKSAVSLSLGAAETARTLNAPGAPVVIDGTVDVTNSSITVNMLGNTVRNGVLEVDTAAAENLTLARLVTAGTVQGNTVTLTGTPEMQELLSKYYTNARLESDGAIKVDRVTDYYTSRLSVEENAQVGIDMADAALVKLNPQANRSEFGELAGVLDALDAAVASGNTAAAEELGAAVSGASVAALGAAVAGDLERQLMSVRNRTTTMGVDQSQVNENMPYFNAWINAEGDFRRMDEDGMAAGYELSSWGGTVGFDVDVTPRFTMGLAATAMYGDFTAKSVDRAEGDLDTYYVTAFARYAANRWSHTFVASVGMADTTLKRTVTHSHGSYSAEGDAEGTSFGFLYEMGYVLALNESATACLQPVFNVMLTHSSLDGYTEEGGDAALCSSGVDMTTVTFGLGARAQAIVGTNVYNRSTMVEARALVKLRAGDREAETDSEFGVLPGAVGSVTAAELGTFGAELGVGITIPMGTDGGSVFADASVELGGGYTNFNGTLGYRINF